VPVLIIGFVKAGVSNAPWGNDSECLNDVPMAVAPIELTTMV
jgi:hypothetical protein